MYGWIYYLSASSDIVRSVAGGAMRHPFWLGKNLMTVWFTKRFSAVRCYFGNW